MTRRIACGRVQWFLIQWTGTKKRGRERGAFMGQPGHAVLVEFSVELRRNLIYNGCALAELQPVLYEENFSTVQEFNVQMCSGNGTIGKTSWLGPLVESFTVQNLFLNGRKKKTEAGNIVIWSIWVSFTSANLKDMRWSQLQVQVWGWCSLWYYIHLMNQRVTACPKRCTGVV